MILKQYVLQTGASRALDALASGGRCIDNVKKLKSSRAENMTKTVERWKKCICIWLDSWMRGKSVYSCRWERRCQWSHDGPGLDMNAKRWKKLSGPRTILEKKKERSVVWDSSSSTSAGKVLITYVFQINVSDSKHSSWPVHIWVWCRRFCKHFQLLLSTCELESF